jgi:hypothetical protein
VECLVPPIAEDSKQDHAHAPRDYDELYRQYRAYMLNLVRMYRKNMPENMVEDVVSDIVTSMMARDLLGKFDPTAEFEFEGEMRPARFKTYLSKTVLTYLKGHRDKYGRRRKHEYISLDTPIPNSGGVPVGATANWAGFQAEMHISPEDEVLTELADRESRADCRAYLATVPRRSPSDRCDLAALFDAVCEQIDTRGEWDIPILKDRFGVSPTAMHGWLWFMREELASYLGIPLPAKRPRRTKAQMAQAREAEQS